MDSSLVGAACDFCTEYSKKLTLKGHMYGRELSEWRGEGAKFLSGRKFSRQREASALTPKQELTLCVWGTAGLQYGWSLWAMGKDDEMGKHRRKEGLAGHMGTFSAVVRILFFNWVKWKVTGGFWAEERLDLVHIFKGSVCLRSGEERGRRKNN